MSPKRRQCIRTILVLSLLVSVVSCISALPAQEPAKPKPRTVATFNGIAITDEDLRKAAEADLDDFNLQIQQMTASLAQVEHKILENNLTRLLVNKMFEAEASKKGITKEAFLEKALEGKIKEPSQQDVNTFYEANKQRINKPLDQAADQIRQYLKTENRSRAIGDIADSLKAQYSVSILLPPVRMNVGTEGSPSRGPKEAPVTIVEFSDFQCPDCQRLNKTLNEVLTKYGNEVRIVYRQYPLPQIHPFAEKAAEASLCAADQNHFWELHDLMFETQNALKEDELKSKAAKLKLDSAAFESCLTSGKYAERVKQDQRDGFRVGVTNAPALFVNGRLLSGAFNQSDLLSVIDEEIRHYSSRIGGVAAGAVGTKAAPPAAKMP